MEQFNAATLLPCPFCDRTFTETALKVHLRSCGKGKTLPAEVAHLADERAAAMGPSPMEVYKAKGPVRKPRFVTCFLCGSDFGKSSLPLHQKRCKELWLQREAKKPKGQRRPLPAPPEAGAGAGREAANDAAFEAFNERSLIACPFCARTFREEPLRRHLRSCGKGETIPPELLYLVADGRAAAEAPSPAQVAKARGSAPRRPKFVMCHLCGREFGKSSLPLHKKKCEELWLQREAKKPPKERRPLPAPPELGATPPAGPSVQAYNDAAFEAYNQRSLLPCERCGRTFNETALKVHLRSCKGAPAASPRRRAKGGGGGVEVSSPRRRRKPAEKPAAAAPAPAQVECHVCGRPYREGDELDRHTERCERLWEERQSARPPDERLPLPERPER